ncbi:hypothetical protein BJ875DRAFT_123112 [Amylocarpus encephaloides]|uniref:Uncharacterized protein n=1 Tax=Amylocarpus encephaloides TaxID=45428 RepID=A0A9P7YDF8_9HELO|nr:hypothetical protein BJ875DRAFT_123112 [Amylocarpus encephaloides]
MLKTAIGSLARRGYQVYTSREVTFVSTGKDHQQYQMPVWGVMLMGMTFLVFFFALEMINYTFGHIIPTLLMIENPQEAIAFEPLPTNDTDGSLNKAPEVQPTKPRPITSSFRMTIQLLQSKGGFRSRFRGFGMFFVYAFATNVVATIVSSIPFVHRGLATVIAMVLCAQLSLAWTLIVISEPSTKSWRARIPGLKTWKKVAGPTAIVAVTEQIAILIPLYFAMAMGLAEKDPRQMVDNKETGAWIGKSIATIVMALVIAFFIVIPANVSLTRVQASLIPEDEETIVPFDRTFNGKVVPEIVGGSGVLGLLDAWKTFNWDVRIGLIKAYVKVFFMQVGLIVVFGLVLLAQAFFIAGKDIYKIFPPRESRGSHASLI